VTYSYDLLDRLVEKSYHETGKPDFTIRYTYNAESQLARLRYEEDGETVGSYAFEYDSLGRLIRSTAMDENGSVTQRTEHLYDAFNRLSGQSWTLGAQTYSERYAYSDGEKGDGSLTSMTAATGDSLSFGYDALKRLNRVTAKSGSSVILNTAYAYRDVSWNRGSAQVEFRNVRLGSDSGMLLEGKKYVYDDVGNLKEIRESTGKYNKLVEYAYDSQNQLTSEAYYKSGEAEAYITYNYTYDTAGNLLTVSQKEGDTTTLLQTYTYGDAQWHDLLTAVNGQAITYDASGNPLSYGGWSFGWQNGRQLKTASKTSDGKTETLEYAYDADGIRTSKTYTVETFTQLPDYTVTFTADGTTVKTMTVEDGYTLKDSDYPAVPTKTGYTGEWVKYTSAVHSNVTVQAKYTAVSTDHTVTFKANGKTVKTMVVPDGYVLQDSDYPPIPPRVGYKGSWSKVTTAIRRDTVIYASYMPNGGGIVIPTQPTSPGEIMSGGEGEPVEADAPAEDETVSPQGMHVTGTQTVTHEYLTLNGKVARETIKTNNSLTAVLDFVYDESGKPFALKYSTNGTSFQTYYYVLNLQGDVVELIHYIPGFEYESVATYEYDAWGNVSSSGRLAEINPLRYRGYYYDNETGFYYLQSRYYDPANRRFINADCYTCTNNSNEIACNMFTYCYNNPIIYHDSCGTEPVETIDIYGNGSAYCYVYEYSYSGNMSGILGTSSNVQVSESGKLYIYKGVTQDYFEDTSNKPDGFRAGIDFMVGDYISQADPNIQVRDSYRCTMKSQMKAITSILLEYAEGTEWKRTQESLITEWREHNRYAWSSARAKHVDFNNAEEGKGFGYFLWKAVRAVFKS
jgi:RHS repeat-associated protein